MIPPRYGSMLSAIALLIGAQTAIAEGFRTSDYAYAATIDVDERAALYTVPLNEDVYRHTVHTDLSDLCVVNGLNEIVPFALRRTEPSRDAPRVFSPLPLFPLQGSDGIPNEVLKLRLQTGQTSLDVEQPGPNATRNAGAYLIDARTVPDPVTALRLSWAADAPDFSAQINVEQSTDLVNWVPLKTAAPVVNLHFNGQAFVRNEVTLPGAYQTILRLRWVGRPPLVQLNGVAGGATPAEPMRPTVLLRATGTPGKTPGEYEFDFGMQAPIDRLNLELPEANTVVEAAIYARLGRSADWQPINRGRLYRLHVPNVADLTNAPLSIPVTVARHWKVNVANAGGGLGNGLPTLVANVLPEDLLFVARGPAPFRMLYGNASATALALPGTSLVGITADGASPNGSVPAHAASLESPVVLGGDSRLVPVAPAIGAKPLLLWLVLLLGVGTMGVMTWKLSRTL
jgi:Protein of unknown function (DUF3999)